MSAVKVTYFSDVLCVWAYAAERRVQELASAFGEQISIEARYCSVFPDALAKIEDKWGAQGGFEGFNRHLNDVASRFPHIDVHKRLWLETRPRTSASAHLFLKAIDTIERRQRGEDFETVPYLERLSTKAAWATRRAFFAAAKDISDWQVHNDIAEELGLDYHAIQESIRTSEAVAQLARDYELSQTLGVEGSPTFIMNNGRQKLFGNIGYRLLEANVQELLRHPEDEASWC